MHLCPWSEGWSDEAVVDEFVKQLDHWGTKPAPGKQLLDPFLMAVFRCADLQSPPLWALMDAFPTLDDLLGASRKEILSVKGVGRQTFEKVLLELYRRRVDLREFV